jgi:hypothetical protein
MFFWGLTSSGTFTVKLMYLDMLDYNTKYLKKYIWKMKVPLKIKVFMWFFNRKLYWLKTIFLREIGMQMNHNVFVIARNPSNIYFLNAPMQK